MTRSMRWAPTCAPEPATFYRMHGALRGHAIDHLQVRNRVVVCNKTPPAWCVALAGRRCFARSNA